MKSFLLLTAILVTSLAPAGAYAKKPKSPPAPPPATPIPLPSASNPAAALSPYIVNLAQLLSFDRADSTATQPLYTQTTGLLLTLRQELVVEEEKAPAEQKNMFAAAINTADLITAAMNDRDTALGNLKTSQAVAGGRQLESPARKETISQGIKSDGVKVKDIGRAEAVAAERDRERQFIAQGAAATKGDQNAMTAMATNQWTQRAAAWRQKIAASYSQIK
jgi:hypothetical protein